MHEGVARLWKAGAMRDAYALSTRLLAARDPGADQHPFRDYTAQLALAAELHAHGCVAWQLADFSEAQRVLDEAYRIRTTHLGPDHADTLETLERLAALDAYRIDHARARERFTTAVAGFRKLYGEEHLRFAVALRNHAAFLRDSDSRAAARPLIDRVMAMFRRLPTDHPDHIAALKVDALLRVYEADPRGALSQADYAIELGTQCWHSKHPFVAATELTAAHALFALQDYRGATKRLKRATANLSNAYGPHPLVALALSTRALVEHQASPRRGGKAEQLGLKALAIYRRTYARPLAMAQNVLAILVARGRDEQARAVVEELRLSADPSDIALYEAILSRAQ